MNLRVSVFRKTKTPPKGEAFAFLNQGRTHNDIMPDQKLAFIALFFFAIWRIFRRALFAFLRCIFVRLVFVWLIVSHDNLLFSKIGLANTIKTFGSKYWFPAGCKKTFNFKDMGMKAA